MPPVKSKKTQETGFHPYYVEAKANAKRQPVWPAPPTWAVPSANASGQPGTSAVDVDMLNFKGLTIAEPAAPKPYDCEKYVASSNMERIPLVYQPSELVAFFAERKVLDANIKKLNNIEIFDDLDTHLKKLNKIEIFDDLHARFVSNSEFTKRSFISNNVTETAFPREMEFARYFYNNAVIYTKKDFLGTLMKGFDWTLERLWKSSNPKQLKKQPVPQWILLSEAYIANTDFVNPSDKQIRFKSSEWVGRMFIAWAKKKAKCTCVLEATLRNVEPINNVITTVENQRYVLFDDGAYSGSQKAFILSGFLQRMIGSRKYSELYVVIPYYTEFAYDRFRDTISQYVDAFTEDTTLVLEMDTTCHHYTVQSLSNGNTVHIYLWTGGEKMVSCSEIIELYPSADSIKRGFTLEMGRGPGGLGATLTAFEHKVPDALSLNARFGGYFERSPQSALRDHYKHNPPYKVTI